MSGIKKHLIAALLAMAAGLFWTVQVLAGSRDAVLYFQPGQDFDVGDSVSFVVVLTTEKGAPLFDQLIDIFLDGEYQETLTTSRSGTVRYTSSRLFDAGSYTIEAVYAGYQFSVSAPASRTFEVSPAEILIQSVPTLAGLELLFEGQLLKTGPDGVVRISVNRPGVYALELLPNVELLSGLDAEFAQWFPNDYDYQTEVLVPGVSRMQVGFELVSLFAFEFVDPDGNAVNPDRIGKMTLRSSNGDVTTVEPGAAVRLRVNRILARLTGLDSATVRHTVESIAIDGSVVINQGQQRFIYSPNQAVRIELLLYDVRFYGEDVILGSPNGTGMYLELPSGESRYYPFDENREVLITNLARGAYFARIEAQGGVGLSFPLVLSRSQDVRLPVISYVDILGGALLAAGLVFGLPLWGRRRKILGWLTGNAPDGRTDG